jgi:antitoxin component YwqK of YwqJK toxin-antitoxin module
MSILHDAYTALLAGLTHKTGNEIHWQDEYGYSITIEPIDIEKETYIIRSYYPNGQKNSEKEYKKNKLNGKYIIWDMNGWYSEKEFKNDMLNGVSLSFHHNGKKSYKVKYKNNLLHGKCIWWYDNGQKELDIEYRNGLRHGKYLGWFKNKQKWCEEEYENDTLIRKIL